jgi:phosphohistidine phosphatase
VTEAHPPAERNGVLVSLLRHGIAEDRARRDSDRTLTREGRREVARVARALAGMAPPVARIISSPYVRAVQTAEIAAAVTGHEGAVAVDPALVPEADPDGVRKLVAKHADAGHLLLVAHEPLLSGVGRLLLEAPGFVGLARGELVMLEVETAPGQLSARLRSRTAPSSLPASDDRG